MLNFFGDKNAYSPDNLHHPVALNNEWPLKWKMRSCKHGWSELYISIKKSPEKYDGWQLYTDFSLQIFCVSEGCVKSGWADNTQRYAMWACYSVCHGDALSLKDGGGRGTQQISLSINCVQRRAVKCYVNTDRPEQILYLFHWLCCKMQAWNECLRNLNSNCESNK